MAATNNKVIGSISIKAEKEFIDGLSKEQTHLPEGINNIESKTKIVGIAKELMKTDWMKVGISIAIHIASLAYFMSGINTDLYYLRKDFTDFKTNYKTDAENIQHLYRELIEYKVTAGVVDNKLVSIEKELKEIEKNYLEIRDIVRDNQKDYENLISKK